MAGIFNLQCIGDASNLSWINLLPSRDTINTDWYIKSLILHCLNCNPPSAKFLNQILGAG